MCRLSLNLEAPYSWSPQGLSRPVMGLLYLHLAQNFWLSVLTLIITFDIIVVVVIVIVITVVSPP
jgi:hypothetical protein